MARTKNRLLRACFSSSTSKKFTRNNASSYRVQNAKLVIPEVIYNKPEQYSIQRTGLEVYETDDDNFVAYNSSLNLNASKNTSNIDVEDENSESADSENSTDNIYENTTFKLHRGEVVNTSYYNDLTNINFESDYKEMTNSATLNKPTVNLQEFYKGVRCKLLSEWESPLSTIQWEDLSECVEGWITEQTFKDEEVEVKLSGLCILLEQNLNFKFQQLPRSRILYEILLTAGLTPWINVEGLDDDIIDFTNDVSTKKNNNSNSNAPIGQSSGKIGELAQQVCQGKTSDYDKAIAIHNFIGNHVEYPSPNYSNHHKCPTQVLQSGLSNCCDRARLGHEMANAVGLVNRGVHHPGHVWVQYRINGKWVDSDPEQPLGSVWKGMKLADVWTFPSC